MSQTNIVDLQFYRTQHSILPHSDINSCSEELIVEIQNLIQQLRNLNSRQSD